MVWLLSVMFGLLVLLQGIAIIANFGWVVGSIAIAIGAIGGVGLAGLLIWLDIRSDKKRGRYE